ncbi:OsmC family protein [Mesoflavibacter sp. CH_XMU1422-2]|uniref:OsmC family protein n=1 Tax=Mesoflavibacter sp. CH_XMU1422-2 TaxID=3107770 RepID=UPI003009B17B
MKYKSQAFSIANQKATITVKSSSIDFGITSETDLSLPNPAELFLSSLSACILKNIERFSQFMHFEYERAEIEITATRLEKPPRMDNISYELKIYSKDEDLNLNLLKKNIEKFGTIYNTVKDVCTITGNIKQIK